MTRTHQYIALFFIFAFLGTGTSCKKFLEVTPKHAIEDDAAIVDQNSAEQALRGVYRALGDYQESYVQLQVLAGGDATYNNVGDPHLIISHDFRADNSYFDGAWGGIYRTINQANLLIQKVPELTDPTFSETDKNQLLGEALFIRSLAYFDLARIWGGVPLKLTPTDNLNEPLGISRSSLEETYAQIEADLQAADQHLSSATTVNRIRASKAAVQALKSRLYLYEKKWAEAAASASLLLGNSDYELLHPFTAWFKGDIGTRESILEIAFSTQNTNGLRNTFQHQTKGGSYSVSPTTATANLLNDPNIGGGLTGRRALVGSLTQAGTTIWYGDLYFRSPATDPIYLLRIAEQYLIRAEARVYTEDLSGALSDLNEIRQRANLPGFTAATLDIQNPQAILRAIEEERRFEFLWEGDRWPDLVRTGRAKELFQLEDYKLLFPIPLDEVVIGKLTQNPGYN